jgi:hypothetical protein
MSEQIREEELNPTEIMVLNTNFDMYGTVDRPLFLASDVAEMIEYSQDKVGQMLENVDDDEKLTDTIYRGGQRREMWFLTENGLYELLMQSRKPLAKAFKYEIKNLLRQIRMGEVMLRGDKRFVIDRDKTLMIENATIMFRNFSGEQTKFNSAGDRNFCVMIDDARQAQQLAADGWNVKILKPREEGDEPKHYINVKVCFDNFPPKIILISGRTKTALDDESVELLDQAEIQNIDLTIRPYTWDVNGNTGIKAYLKDMYVTIRQDLLAAKYADDEYAE